MAQDRPTLEELVTAVEEFVRDDVMPRLEGRPAFHARVATNVLGMIRRELATGAALDAEERRRIVALLSDHDPDPDDLSGSSTKELNRKLCRLIRSGIVIPDDPGLRRHLWATALAKLSIDNPRYGGYLRALEEREGGS